MKGWVQVRLPSGKELPVTEQHYRTAGYRPDVGELPSERVPPATAGRAGTAAPEAPAPTRLAIPVE